MEKTLAIIKPDAVERRIVGSVILKIELASFCIVDMKMIYMSKRQAKFLYKEHRSKPFFERLVNFMSSGPSIFLVLEKKNAIEDWRSLMGPAKVADAYFNSIRGCLGLLGKPTHENVVHGSDSPESAVRELGFFWRISESID